jgi:hypothetical protein
VTAPIARVDFTERQGDTWLTVELVKPAVARTSDYNIIQQEYYPLESRRLQSPAQEDASWYDWPKLLRTLENPIENRQIRKYFQEEILRGLAYDMLAQAVVSTIQAGSAYGELRDAQYTYQIRAGKAWIADKGEVCLEGAGARPVEVTVFRNGEAYHIITAKSGRIEATWSILSETSFVSIEFRDDVQVLALAEGRGNPQVRSRYAIGQLPIPADFEAKSKTVKLLDVVNRPQELTSTKFLHTKIRGLKDYLIPRLINRIKAEMHMRAAYSLSCLLMVAMGAALGSIFRGGQIITAFAITAVPAALVIVMMITGKQMVRSQSVPAYIGLATIWAGVLSLVGANAVIYLLLSRK